MEQNKKSCFYPKYHCFRPRDPGAPPMGLGAMSVRDQWRYAQSLSRFKTNHPDVCPGLIAGEIGVLDGFRIILS